MEPLQNLYLLQYMHCFHNGRIILACSHNYIGKLNNNCLILHLKYEEKSRKPRTHKNEYALHRSRRLPMNQKNDSLFPSLHIRRYGNA